MPHLNFQKIAFGTKKIGKKKKNWNSYGLMKIWLYFNH
jgi:hypothetical protein